MAVAARMMQVIEAEGLVDRAAVLGERVTAKLNALREELPCNKQVRGRGLFLGIELDTDAGWFDTAGQVVTTCLDQGLMIGSAQANIVRFAPPLIVTEAQLDQAIDTLAAVLKQQP